MEHILYPHLCSLTPVRAAAGRLSGSRCVGFFLAVFILLDGPRGGVPSLLFVRLWPEKAEWVFRGSNGEGFYEARRGGIGWGFLVSGSWCILNLGVWYGVVSWYFPLGGLFHFAYSSPYCKYWFWFAGEAEDKIEEGAAWMHDRLGCSNWKYVSDDHIFNTCLGLANRACG